VPVKPEIERKFLVTGTGWKAGAPGRRLRQGYLAADDHRQVRIRTVGDAAWLTIKGRATGATRLEFEYPIPLAHAERLLEELCCPPIIDKTRYEVLLGSHTWEVDEYHGANAGLVVAEIELGAEDESFALPEWAGIEVTHEPRYSNASLVSRPFCDWPDES
jgi:CYTH domain-containing protein